MDKFFIHGWHRSDIIPWVAQMRICFVSPEVFSWGYHGGFGFITRTLSRELARMGHEVSVVTVRRGAQGEIEKIDGVTAYGFPSYAQRVPRPLAALLSRRDSMKYYRNADAEIYHSVEVSYNTVAAQLAMANRFHVITFQDPYDLYEWERISKVDSRYRMTPSFKARLAIENRILAKACARADALYAQAHFLVERATRLFRIRRRIGLLPNPVEIPKRKMKKADHPTVCFLARWDPQKRVEVFFNLARELPKVEFIAMGHAHDKETDVRLRKKYGSIPNLKLVGFVSEEEKSRILERSWALVNTSVREALPVSFLESLAHETPIISGEDPDSLTSRYGYYVVNDDYVTGLRRLLSDDDFREKGRRGRSYVEAVHEVSRVMTMHEDAYRSIIESIDSERNQRW